MKKIMLVIICFLAFNIVNAKTLSIEEVMDGFMNSTFIKSNQEGASEDEKVSIRNNEDDKTLDIYVGSEKLKSYSYAPGYIDYSDNREITRETLEESTYDFFFLASFFEGIVNKSGFDFSRLNDVSDDFVFDFDRYGIDIQTEEYDLTFDSMRVSGDYFRSFKIGFDTEKIAAFVDAVGLKSEEEVEDLTNIIPTIKLIKKTNKSVELNVNVEGGSGKTYYCNIYRSTNKDSGYIDIYGMPVDCSNKDVNLVDDEVKENTTYYYKAMVSGGSKYSEIFKVYIGSNVKNPKTGVYNQLIPIIFGFVIGLAGLYYFQRKITIKL